MEGGMRGMKRKGVREEGEREGKISDREAGER